jgi:hypothetical protein
MQNNNKININLRHTDKGIIINIKVIPGSSQSGISGVLDGVIKLKLHSPPIEGKANIECIELLSKALSIPKSSIEIVNGSKGKTKSVLIKGEQAFILNQIDNLI